jgi:hypothetical protein
VHRCGRPALPPPCLLAGGALLALALCVAAGCCPATEPAEKAFALEAGPIWVPPYSVENDEAIAWPTDLSQVVADDGATLCGVLAYRSVTLAIEGVPSGNGVLDVATPRGGLGRLRLHRGRALPPGDLLTQLGAPVTNVLRSLREASVGGHNARPVDFRFRLLVRWWPDDLEDTTPLTLTRFTMRGTFIRGYDLYAEGAP